MALYRQVDKTYAADQPAVTSDGELIEIGGVNAGLEFHKGYPLPTRISFYYPIANSVDLSTDYWKRYQSRPLSLQIFSENTILNLDSLRFKTTYTPFSASFNHPDLSISYAFGHSFPFFMQKIKVKNDRPLRFVMTVEPLFRTCHTYAARHPTLIEKKEMTVLLYYHYTDTDSVVFFSLSSGFTPHHITLRDTLSGSPLLDYHWQLPAGAEGYKEIIQLWGCCKPNELNYIIDDLRSGWESDIENQQRHLTDYAFHRFRLSLPDNDLIETANWSRALIQSNHHFLHDWILPMPCPAQYNFFFTHDFLVTCLGTNFYDPHFMKNGLGFLLSKTKADSVLPHAYYWKDGSYVTEFCTSESWNLLWFIIALSNYYKHSYDLEMIKMCFPLAKKSVHMLMQQLDEDLLVNSSRPDWWDIGNVYGAKSYMTILMIRALQDYVFIAQLLAVAGEKEKELLYLAEEMKRSLTKYLWDENKKYLLNRLDGDEIDHHFYSGSLLAAYYDAIDQKSALLNSAEQHLLDLRLGIRNAMPADFHHLIERYRFNGNEAGNPWLYFNGAVWPQGNAWYILGLIADNRIDQAHQALVDYLTLSGIKTSPNGQPSFYEYRNSNAFSDEYGKIDKPAFLWAGGWFLKSLYHLIGVRENPWNLSFDARLAEKFVDIGYDLCLHGRQTRIDYRNKGPFFKEIKFDGRRVFSAVLHGSPEHIELERGVPVYPYLAEATCRIKSVSFENDHLTVSLLGLSGQRARLTVVSPLPLEKIRQSGLRTPGITRPAENTPLLFTVNIEFTQTDAELLLAFSHDERKDQ